MFPFPNIESGFSNSNTQNNDTEPPNAKLSSAMTSDMSSLKRRRPRRSAGCEPCKSRRMKCSENKPACDECIKRGVGVECTYSSDQIIFQSENAFIEQSFKKVKTVKRKPSTTSVSTYKSTPEADSSGRSTPDEVAKITKRRKKQDRELTPLSLVTSAKSTSTSPELIVRDNSLIQSSRQYLAHDEILPGQGYSRWTNSIEMQLHTQEGRALKAFFEDFLPCEIILGNHKGWAVMLKKCLKEHPILRNITLAISRVNIGGWYSNYEDACQNRLKALEHYSLALKDLQQALDDPKTALRDDTLLSVNLFGVYEMVKGNSLESLYRHILGGLSVLRLRGAKSHLKPGVTQSIAASYQGEAIRKSLENRTKTFFAEPEWVEASRTWTPLNYNKWCGTELNCLLLRLTEVNATDGYNLEAASGLLRDLLDERQRWFPDAWYIPNSVLDQNNFRVLGLDLCNSAFGTKSTSYDLPSTREIKLTLASITFDYAILVLYHTYPSLMADPDRGYYTMTGMMQAAQYLLHDSRNHTSAIIADVFAQIIHCCHWTRTERELDWVLFMLDMSGVAIARKVGRLGKARIREGLESEDLKTTAGKDPMFGAFLESTGLDKSLNHADDHDMAEHLVDSEPGFRSTSF